MTTTELLITGTFMLLCLAMFIAFLFLDIKGCEGNCQQGDRPCNCKLTK